jgi:hypothetical protein
MFLGCPGPQTPDPGENDETTSSVNEVVPRVEIPSEFSNFTLTNVHLSRSSTGSGYIYGILEIEYTGSSELSFVKFDFDYIGKDGEVIHSDWTYLRNERPMAISSDIYTNTVLTPEAPVGFVYIIEDLSTYDSDLEEVEEIRITDISSDSNNVLSPPSGTITFDAPKYTTSSDQWLVPFSVELSTTISNVSSVFIFSNQDGKPVNWTFAGIEKSTDGDGWVIATVFEPGDEGRLQSPSNTPSYVPDPYGLYTYLVDWDLKEPESSINASTQSLSSRGFTETLSVDEINEALHSAGDQSLDQQRQLSQSR